MALRAAIYARQSITREGSASLKAQVDACRATAKRLKLKVVVELVEAPSTSGYRNRGRSRPKFQELLTLIRDRDVDCVVTYKTDRLSRGGGPGWRVDVGHLRGLEHPRRADRHRATVDRADADVDPQIRAHRRAARAPRCRRQQGPVARHC
jgi:DNA invertase Pin-like site-specific DNA recombinase